MSADKCLYCSVNKSFQKENIWLHQGYGKFSKKGKYGSDQSPVLPYLDYRVFVNIETNEVALESRNNLKEMEKLFFFWGECC